MSESSAAQAPAPGNIHIWRVPLDGPGPSLNALMAHLAAGEQSRAAQFRFERDRRRYVVARAALRTLLSRALSVSPLDLHFVYGVQGKPALAARLGSDLQFNVAHSHEMALIALSRGVALGVDIEHARPLSDMERIARRFFSAQETAALMATTPETRPRTFFRIWSRKEAFIKATGKGLSQPLGSFNVMAPDGAPLAYVELQGAVTSWQLWDLDIAPGYGAALAAWRNAGPLQLHHFTYQNPDQ